MSTLNNYKKSIENFYEGGDKILLKDILKYNYYINLLKRVDRKKETEIELKNFGIDTPSRFEAIEHEKGGLGCSLSHLKVLQNARDKGYPYVFVFEDDVQFLNSSQTYEKLEKVLNSNLDWDVILLGGNNFRPFEYINEDLIKVSNCQTRTAYLVKENYYNKLINNFENSIRLLSNDYIEKNRGDQYWKKLQREDKWFLINPLEVVQRPSYSDIEKKNVDYTNRMKYSIENLKYNTPVTLESYTHFRNHNINIPIKNKEKINLKHILKYHYYINLDHRKDRKKDTEIELKKFGIGTPVRFNAIKNKKGDLGCAMSHIKVLENARDKGYPYVFVFEDDVQFLNPTQTYNKLEKVLNSNLEWDVILLGGNNYRPFKRISEDLIKVANCQTTTAYLIKERYYNKLINNFKECAKLLKKTKKSKYTIINFLNGRSAIDQYWKKLQRTDNWFLLSPVEVVQRPSYSDIENRNVDYTNMMKSNNIV